MTIMELGALGEFLGLPSHEVTCCARRNIYERG
jgi:hypothetical protein